jgi:hypothetical protein
MNRDRLTPLAKGVGKFTPTYLGKSWATLTHVAADLTEMANLAAFLGNRDIDRFLVHVHTDVSHKP